MKVIILSTFDDDRYMTPSEQAQSGFARDMPSEELAQTLRQPIAILKWDRGLVEADAGF